MALTPNFASAGIVVVDARAKAAVTPGDRSVFFHLTQGFDLGRANLGAQPGEAVGATGHVAATASGAKPLTGWQFGFIQITKMISGQAFYAGRVAREGSISVMFERAMPAALLLDSMPDRTPWTRAGERFVFEQGEIDCGTSDHPALKVPRVLRNSGRNVDNFLFHVVDDRLFWSVFTAIEPTGARHHLAHLHWQVQHNVQFRWRRGEPESARSSGAGYRLLRNVRGGPTEPELQALLANPQPPHFNPAADHATLQAFLGGRGANRTENDRWFVNVAQDFYG